MFAFQPCRKCLARRRPFPCRTNRPAKPAFRPRTETHPEAHLLPGFSSELKRGNSPRRRGIPSYQRYLQDLPMILSSFLNVSSLYFGDRFIKLSKLSHNLSKLDYNSSKLLQNLSKLHSGLLILLHGRAVPFSLSAVPARPAAGRQEQYSPRCTGGAGSGGGRRVAEFGKHLPVQQQTDDDIPISIPARDLVIRTVNILPAHQCADTLHFCLIKIQ